MADYRQIATQAAQTYGIPVDTFLSLLGAESSWNPNALSPKGAIGLGQLMPATAKELGVDPYDPEQNIYGSAKYLAQQFERFGDPALAVAAYNAGPSAVAKYGGIPPYEETQNYVARVMGTQMADQMTPQQMAPQQAAGYQQFGPENLSRSQRTMLGFAALRDAAAALRGNQTSFFSDAYSGLEQQHRYGQELAFRQAQEQRLIDERAAAARQNATQAQLRAAEALYQVQQQLQWAPNDPTLLALRDSLMAQALPSGAAPAGAVPVGAPTTAPATTPAMTLPSATTAANDPSKLSDEELASAMSVLATSNDPKAIAALEIMRDEAATRAEGAQTAEAAARRKAEVGAMIQREGGIALGFLVQKDESGNPIFENGAPKLNSQLATRPSRALAAMEQSQEYQDFVGSLLTIKSTLTIDNLARLAAQKVTLGQITESEWPRIEAMSGALDPNNPAGTLRTLLRLQEDYDLDFGLTPPAASGTDDLSDEELQELYIPKG